MDYFEQIEAYLNNTLPESERLAFEEAMESDSKLKQAVDDHAIAKDVVGSILEDEVRKVIEGEVKKESKGGAGDLSGEEGQRDKGGVVRRMNWMRWASAAAVVFVVGWWGVNQTGMDDDELYSKVYREASWPTERGDNDQDLSKAISKFLNGNVTEAKADLKSLGSDESNLWLAEIYFKEMHFDSTLIYLPLSKNADNINKRDRINYLNILSLYFNDSKAKSEEAFKNLPEDTDGFYDPIYKELAF